MTKLVTISGKEMCKLLEKIDFEKIYGKGSHVRFKHKKILRQINISKEEYEELRR